MYNNTISGTASEKGGNDNIITVYSTCTIIISLAQQLKKEVMIILYMEFYTVIILSLPPFSVAVPEIVL
jgi:hypothetical protein